MTTTTTTTEPPLHLDWTDVRHLCRALAAEVRSAGPARAPDAIVAVARGGLVPAALLARLLGVRRVLALQVVTYAEEARAVSGGALSSEDLGVLDTLDLGCRVLVVDDCWESGRTGALVRAACLDRGLHPRIAVLHDKPALHVAPGGPDYRATCTERWIVYPWEDVEMEG